MPETISETRIQQCMITRARLVPLIRLFSHTHTHTHTQTHTRTHTHPHALSDLCLSTFSASSFLSGYYLPPRHMPFPCPFTSGKYKFHTLTHTQTYIHTHSLSHTQKYTHTYTHTNTHTRIHYPSAEANVTFMRFCAFKLLSGLYQEMKSLERNFAP